jgi:hypothetical protein
MRTSTSKLNLLSYGRAMAKKNKYADWTKEELIKQIAALEKRKKYGLVWDEERTKEKFEADAKNKLPVLKEIKSKEIKTDPNKPTHILIEGDNYHALSVLNYTHEKAIDVIYIDPPYNLGGKDFMYNDRYVEATDAYRHSMWLSFMHKRLMLAKYLLKPNGIIFISINDIEFAQLKMLLNMFLCMGIRIKQSFLDSTFFTVIMQRCIHMMANMENAALKILKQQTMVVKKEIP